MLVSHANTQVCLLSLRAQIKCVPHKHTYSAVNTNSHTLHYSLFNYMQQITITSTEQETTMSYYNGADYVVFVHLQLACRPTHMAQQAVSFLAPIELI